ncbi:MAG: M36 family metallopeptidase, partial [Saprospiraceae bacterium]|nr:M36 family metallopeptidase [Saprospiraceae bacterium]
MQVSSETFSKASALNHIYFQQYIEGIPVYNAILGAHIKADNTLFTFNSTFVDIPQNVVVDAEPKITQQKAIEIAAKHFEYNMPQELKIKSEAIGKNKKTVFRGDELSQEDIPVELIWVSKENGNLTLTWQVQIHEPNGANYWSVRIDASSGEVLDQQNLVISCNFGISEAKCNHSEVEHNMQRTFMPPAAFKEEFSQEMEMLSPADGSSYSVFREPAESPIHTSTVSPADGRTIAIEPAHPVASPFGWHDTNGATGPEFTITRGNNTHAYTDLDANDIPDPGTSPDGGAGLDFNTSLDLTMGPATYRPSAVVNLFYWNNYMHDFAHRYGFDEASGNFQVNNYGRGGTGGDDVRAEAQDGSATNNATFLTLPEGQRPRMHMFVWTSTTPNRDSDFDNGIIAHEYAHGISTRLAGGPATTSCLGGQEQMGEGWSDYYSLMTTSLPTDVANTPRGIGTYVLGQPTSGAGIRPRRYTPDMTVNEVTYDFIKTASIPHGVGFVWATMLWDLTWALRDRHGLTAGTDISINLVNQGLKLQVCNAGFVDGRNAIIQADMALNGGANVCLIWQVFARRGLGFSASQGLSSSRSDGTQAFDLPPACNGVVTPTGVLASDGTFTDKVRVTWTGNPGNWFRVYRNTTNNSGTALALGIWQNTTTYDDASAVAGTTHHYWVRAASDNAGSDITAFSSGDTGFRSTSAPVVTVPASVLASDGTFLDKIQVTWTGTNGNWFRVYRNTTDDSGSATAIGSWQNTTSYDDNSANVGVFYFYWVRAASDNLGSNISDFSNGDFGYRGLPPGTVILPTNVQATDGAFSDRVRVTWSGTAGNWFRVYRASTNNINKASPISEWQLFMTLDDFSVAQGTTFWYWVRAASDNSGANISAFSTGNSGFRSFGGPTVTVPANVQASDGTFTDKVQVT